VKNKVAKTTTAVTVLTWRPIISVISKIPLSAELLATIRGLSDSILKVKLASPVQIHVILKVDIPSVAADRLCARIAREVEAYNQHNPLPQGNTTEKERREARATE